MIPSVNWTNVSDGYGIMAAPNAATGGWFWTAMVYMIYVIAVIILASLGLEGALLVASFVILMGAIYLAYAALISWWVVGSLVGIIIIVTLMIHYFSR